MPPNHRALLDIVALIGWLLVPALTGSVVALVVEYRVGVGQRKDREKLESDYEFD